jgi:hypothetical protein
MVAIAGRFSSCGTPQRAQRSGLCHRAASAGPRSWARLPALAEDLGWGGGMAGPAASASGPRGGTAASGLGPGLGNGDGHRGPGCVPRGLFIAVEGIDGAGRPPPPGSRQKSCGFGAGRQR